MSGLTQIIQKYSHSRIAVYGLGKETEKILSQLECNFQIIGLLDSYRKDGIIYGHAVISMQQAIEKAVQLILVVARPGSCRAIARKICRQCIEHKIALFDIRGRDLCSQQTVTYDFKGFSGMTKKRLMQMAESREVVSFDLFDTLVMRQVLFSTDIFDLVDHRLRDSGIYIKDFSNRRLETEKRLSKTLAPALTEIYTCMVNTYTIQEISPQKLAELEWETDYNCLIPRKEMCDLLEQISRTGKKIYIVSDTYYRKEQIVSLLNKCGISCYIDILLSCEFGMGKTQGLFGRLKEVVPAQSYLHIGDDVVADVEYAQKNGISVCQIYSGIELLSMVGYLGFWDWIVGLENRIKTGIFVSRLFNSPFQFETEGHRIYVKNAEDIGYLFLAPMISDFVLWFYRQVCERQIQNVWFGARDGFLIKKLYDELNENDQSVYFLTSRTASVRAGVHSESDIKYVSEMKFSGSVQEELIERFGILGENDIKKELEDYTEEILAKAIVERSHYKKYIEGLDVQKGDIAFFDFVAKGTSQMFIDRFVENHMIGFYFLQMEREYMKDSHLEIYSFYRSDDLENSVIFDNYYILETILTSSAPSLQGFDKNGKPCYAKETRSKRDIICIQQVQDGIYDYFKTFRKLCQSMEPVIDRRIDEMFLMLIHQIYVLDNKFINLIVEDPFFNRRTDIKDLI